MAKPPSASCSATGTNRAACLLGHDFLRVGEPFLAAILVDQPDVIPVCIAGLRLDIAPFVTLRAIVGFADGPDQGATHANVAAGFFKSTINGIAVYPALVAHRPLEARSCPAGRTRWLVSRF